MKGLGQASQSSGILIPKAGDIYQIALLVYADLVTRVVGPKHWAFFARTAAYALNLIRRTKTRYARQRVTAVFTDGIPGKVPAAKLVTEAGARQLEELMLMRKVAHRADWRPAMRVHGADAVEERLAQNGVMLWSAPSTPLFNLLPLIAHDAGWPRLRLSASFHGPSKSPFGRKYINPHVIRVENRYAPRIILTKLADRAVFRRVREALAARQAVMVHAVGNGVRLDDFPLLGGQIRLATGMVKLAIAAGASVIGVTVARAGDGVFDVYFTPIADPSDGVTAADAGRRMAGLIGDAMLEDPAQWRLSVDQIHL